MSANDHLGPNVAHSLRHSVLGRLRRRLVASIAGVTGWIVFALLWVAFWASGYSLFQNIAVVVVSLVILFGVLASLWVSFGLGVARHWSDDWD